VRREARRRETSGNDQRGKDVTETAKKEGPSKRTRRCHAHSGKPPEKDTRRVEPEVSAAAERREAREEVARPSRYEGMQARDIFRPREEVLGSVSEGLRMPGRLDDGWVLVDKVEDGPRSGD
jgi:hypothetical protein